jgi:hypothetical protein
VLAQVEEWGTVVEVVPRRLREERLAPVPGCADPGGQVDVESDVSRGDPRRLACVDSDPDTNRPLGKRLVRIERSGGCVGCGGERDEERVPCVSTSTPACEANAERRIRRCSASAPA